MFDYRRTATLMVALCLLLTSSEPVQAHLRRELFFGNNTPSVIGERCNRRHSCQEGLTCMRAPSCLGLLTPRKVCMPVECMGKAALDLDKQVNVTGYQETIFATAGVTADQFFMRDKKDRSFRPLTAYGTAKAMVTSDRTYAVMDAIRGNPIAQDAWQAYEAALSACDPKGKLSEKDSFGFGPSVPGIKGTVSFGAAAGAVLGGGVEFFFAFPGSDPFFFIDLGGGIFFGADIGPKVGIGMVFTGAPGRDIPGVGFELDGQIPVPGVSPGIAVGLSLDGTWSMKFTIGTGPGTAIGSFFVEYTWGIDIPPRDFNDTNSDSGIPK